MKFMHALPFAAALATAAPLVAKRNTNILNGKSVATWWGQETIGHESLADVCSDGSFDIVMLAFVTELTPPTLNLAGHAGGPSKAQQDAGLKSLIDGTVAPQGSKSIADQIKDCQSSGHKVMISFGGDRMNTNARLTSDKDAEDGATQLWELFLGGKSSDAKVAASRPFGDVVLDGVDLDNETGQSRSYEAFAKKLRSLMDGDKGRTYLMSGSPQHIELKSSNAMSNIPDTIYQYLDFLNVQFYNNPQDPGNLGGPKFVDSVSQWNDKIKGKNSKAKLMVTVPASNKAATGKNAGIRSAADIAKDIAAVKARNFSQLGGVSIWSAGYAMENSNWQQAVKKAVA